MAVDQVLFTLGKNLPSPVEGRLQGTRVWNPLSGPVDQTDTGCGRGLCVWVPLPSGLEPELCSALDHFQQTVSARNLKEVWEKIYFKETVEKKVVTCIASSRLLAGSRERQVKGGKDLLHRFLAAHHTCRCFRLIRKQSRKASLLHFSLAPK